MRVLCLHGKGTSGAIFNTQTISFRARLPTSLNLDFNFIDGPVEDRPAPGVDLFYPPPFYCFYQDPSAESIAAARKWLSEYIAETGPYDAVLTFSQGCAIAASLLLHHELETPHLPPPFKAAIFICGGTPLLDLVDMGFEISQETKDRDVLSAKLLSAQADSSAILKSGTDRWANNTGFTGTEDDWRNEIQGGPCRISIPTVHVYGEKDPRYVAGVQLSGLCDPAKRSTYNHGGGHEIPRKEVVSNTIAGLVAQVLRQ